MNKRNSSNPGRERGVAMVVALVLLVAATLTALFTNRNLVFGVKSQANQIKSVMAHEAAMGGLETALAVLAKNVNRENLLAGTPAVDAWYAGRLYGFFLDTDGDGNVNTLSLVQAVNGTAPTIPAGVISSFQVRFKRLSTPAAITDPNMAIRIDVLGCADGQAPNATDGVCTSRAIVTQSTLLKPAMASAPAAALTAKGDVILSGNVQITNTDAATNGTTIHSGGTVTGLGSSDLISLPGTPEEASVAPEDETLNNLTPDQYFQGFFGGSKDSVKADAIQVTCEGSSCGGDIKDVEGEGEIIWVNTEGGATINASGTEGQIGSATEPVILIVDGLLQITGNVIIYGLVYCSAITWDNTGGGTSQIIGAAIAEGNFEATGTPNPTYDPDVLDKLKNNLASYARIGGGWKDWCSSNTDCSFTAW